jgi:hypothetical protein
MVRFYIYIYQKENKFLFFIFLLENNLQNEDNDRDEQTDKDNFRERLNSQKQLFFYGDTNGKERTESSPSILDFNQLDLETLKLASPTNEMKSMSDLELSFREKDCELNRALSIKPRVSDVSLSASYQVNINQLNVTKKEKNNSDQSNSLLKSK